MIIQIILLTGVLLGLAYYKTPQFIFSIGLGLLLLSWQLWGGLGYIGIVIWPLYLGYAVFFSQPKYQKNVFYHACPELLSVSFAPYERY